MPAEDKTAEREQTDESLRVEREKADADLGEKLAAIDEAADAVIEKARARADQVLAVARAKSDRQVRPPNVQSATAIDRERGREDKALREERAGEDETLRAERAEHVPLPSAERDATDKDLSSERARSDVALTARDAFLGIVSHDLRNMLGGMVGFAALIAIVSFDPPRILQVLVNLLSNAIKFTPPNGKVVVGVERIGDELRFAVEDTGEGIPRDKLEAVFERFLQLAENDRRGVGLGLYISKCIVQGHGGRIWAESRLGEGSTFCFTLPIQAAP